MKVACIVLAHRLPKQLASLVAALRHPQVRVYLHIDRRKPLAPFTRALSEAGVHDVVLLPRHASRWGSAEKVDAILEGLAAGVTDGCGYFVLVAGQDFPLKPMEQIVAFLEEAGSRSYMEHWPVSESVHRFQGRDRTDFYAYNVLGRRELCIPRGEDVSFLNWKGRTLNELLRVRTAFMPPRSFPRYVRPFAGVSWWNLSRVAAEYTLHFADEHPDYRRYHAHTWGTDELFFQSILLGTEFAERHEVVGDNMRFYLWEGVNARTLTTDDLPDLLASEKLFAHKFDETVDNAVLARLAELVGA